MRMHKISGRMTCYYPSRKYAFHDYQNQYTSHVCIYLTDTICTSVWNMIANSQNNALYGSVAHYVMCLKCSVSV